MSGLLLVTATLAGIFWLLARAIPRGYRTVLALAAVLSATATILTTINVTSGVT